MNWLVYQPVKKMNFACWCFSWLFFSNSLRNLWYFNNHWFSQLRVDSYQIWYLETFPPQLLPYFAHYRPIFSYNYWCCHCLHDRILWVTLSGAHLTCLPLIHGFHICLSVSCTDSVTPQPQSYRLCPWSF